jgi:hypothetical protein
MFVRALCCCCEKFEKFEITFRKSCQASASAKQNADRRSFEISEMIDAFAIWYTGKKEI